MSKMTRLREYAATHGIGYTIRRIGEKAGQVVLGTWDREWKREQPDEEELEVAIASFKAVLEKEIEHDHPGKTV